MTTGEPPAADASADLAARVAASLDGADPDEAAAVAVAIGAHLRDRERAAATAATGGAGRPWSGRRWQFAERLGRGSGRAARVPDSAPPDPWAAAGRVDRF